MLGVASTSRNRQYRPSGFACGCFVIDHVIESPALPIGPDGIHTDEKGVVRAHPFERRFVVKPINEGIADFSST